MNIQIYCALRQRRTNRRRGRPSSVLRSRVLTGSAGGLVATGGCTIAIAVSLPSGLVPIRHSFDSFVRVMDNARLATRDLYSILYSHV